MNGRLRERLRFSAGVLRNHRRGLLYGRRLADSAALHVPSPSRDPGPLEQYFDEHTEGAAIWKWRHYLDIYHRHLERFRGRPVQMVEIGVWAGGSLRMWRDYLGQESGIYGVDIESKCRAHAGERIEIFIGDQGDPAFWREFMARVPDVDVVLDDGGHELEQQVASFEALLPHMRPGGVYICEDVVGVANPFHDYAAGLARNLHSNDGWQHRERGEAYVKPTPLQRMVGSVHIYPFLVVIEKRAWGEGFELLSHGT